VGNAQGVLDGDLDDFVHAYLLARAAGAASADRIIGAPARCGPVRPRFFATRCSDRPPDRSSAGSRRGGRLACRPSAMMCPGR
jgi:hypothetical protein